jgi:glycosyltransferase involved in cell wall biosynthesis
VKVLILAPVSLAISRRLKYAGTERVISGLIEKLCGQGVQCILAASGDSESGKAKLIYTHKRAMWKLKRSQRTIINPRKAEEQHISFALQYAIDNKVDLIHDHIGIAAFNAYDKFKDTLRIPIITTIHEDLDPSQMRKYRRWRKAQHEKRLVYYIAISDSQANKFKRVNLRILDVVRNGVPFDRMPFVGKSGKQDYLFWIGRISALKGTDLAVKLALATGRPLIIAGEVQTLHRKFYEKKVKPYVTHFIDGKNDAEDEKARNRIIRRLASGQRVVRNNEILFLGPLDDRQKGIVYSRAYAHLVPNRWEEPFGLVLPEAMATGTPVIGTRRGAIPEIIVNKVTGYLVQWIGSEHKMLKQAISALERIPLINPADCRRRVARYFSTRVMAQHYVEVYRRILKTHA